MPFQLVNDKWTSVPLEEAQVKWHEAKAAPKKWQEEMAAPKKPVKQTARCTGYDFTSYTSHSGEDPYVFMQRLQPYFKSCTWQLEVGNKCGKKHWQGTGVLFEKVRPDSARRIEIAKAIGAYWMMPTVTKNCGDAMYQQKDFTRLLGPFNLKDKAPKKKTSDVIFVDSIRHKLLYLEPLVEYIKAEPDPREILWLYDLRGKSCKSCVAQWLEYYGLATILPYCGSYKDMLAFAMAYPDRAYVINIARGVGMMTDKQRDEFIAFIAALECLKDAQLHDARYNSRKVCRDRPTCIVFSNCLPLLDGITRGRMKICDFDDDLNMIDITERIVAQHDLKMAERRAGYNQKRAMKEIAHKRKWERAIAKDNEVSELYMALTRRRIEQEEAKKPRENNLTVDKVEEEAAEATPPPQEPVNVLANHFKSDVQFVFEED
jgi:hypothetical protein